MQQQAPGLITSTRQAFDAAVNVPAPPKQDGAAKQIVHKLLFTAYGQAILGALITFLALYLINPPMVQSKSESDIERPVRNLKKVAVWTAIAAALILVIPYGMRYLQGRKVAK